MLEIRRAVSFDRDGKASEPIEGLLTAPGSWQSKVFAVLWLLPWAAKLLFTSHSPTGRCDGRCSAISGMRRKRTHVAGHLQHLDSEFCGNSSCGAVTFVSSRCILVLAPSS